MCNEEGDEKYSGHRQDKGPVGWGTGGTIADLGN